MLGLGFVALLILLLILLMSVCLWLFLVLFPRLVIFVAGFYYAFCFISLFSYLLLRVVAACGNGKGVAVSFSFDGGLVITFRFCSG